MPTPREPSPKVPTAPAGQRPGIEEAEAVLVEHYGRLVRLAHLVLPPALGRHRRVVAAHAVVQDALPHTPGPARAHGEGEWSGGYVWIRERVLRAALRHERRTRRARPYPPRLPLVLGLRLSPHTGGAGELALGRALAQVPAAARAALALRLLEGLAEPETAAVLSAAGVADPDAAITAAGRLPGLSDGSARALLDAEEFDPNRVRLYPTDLLRRRYRARTAATAFVAALLAVSALTAVLASADRDGLPDDAKPAAPARTAAGTSLTDPGTLRTTPAGRWADTTRLDFTAWPARGDRRGDRALLGRALSTWADGRRAHTVTTTPGTPAAPPSGPSQLLFAADVDGTAVVLLHDAATDRVARYAEAAGAARPTLDIARADDASVTTAAALVLTRTPTTVRYLLAPWIAQAGTRDLLRPAEATRPFTAAGGVTPPLPVPAAGGPCTSWPVLSLRSSAQIVEQHAFLATDLGEPSPAHLTHTPPPGSGAPSRQPREAVSRSALDSWARSACLLTDLRGDGVRAVNDWVYARQTLPDRAGAAAWVCTRADTWRGPGSVRVQFQPPATGRPRPGTVVAERQSTAACSRFGQHVVAGTRWRSPRGPWYALAAGSRHIVRIRLSGGVSTEARGPVAAVRAAPGAPVRVTGYQSDGTPLAPLG
ncbi:hypothetical protein [Streptomyces sp. NPDC046887]|uniref:hypothetical protein n=1 Tax=Streptomyces sp. NPDC046887 TaxID=3155472 RepID=UPI0033CBB045